MKNHIWLYHHEAALLFDFPHFPQYKRSKDFKGNKIINGITKTLTDPTAGNQDTVGKETLYSHNLLFRGITEIVVFNVP